MLLQMVPRNGFFCLTCHGHSAGDARQNATRVYAVLTNSAAFTISILILHVSLSNHPMYSIGVDD